MTSNEVGELLSESGSGANVIVTEDFRAERVPVFLPSPRRIIDR